MIRAIFDAIKAAYRKPSSNEGDKSFAKIKPDWRDLTPRQVFAALRLQYVIMPGRRQWFEDGFDEEDEIKYQRWIKETDNDHNEP